MPAFTATRTPPSMRSLKDGIVQENLTVEDRLIKPRFTNTDNVKISNMNELL